MCCRKNSGSLTQGDGWQKGFAILLLTLLLPFAAGAQLKASMALQEQVRQAIARARPACVRMWGFDTLLHQRSSAQFSGVAVKEGYILTAAHVATPANTYRVMFPDGRDCIAVALGKIELSEDKTRPDVALMKIITHGNWPFAEMGRSAWLQPYTHCISIAYPESLNLAKPTVRYGIVSEPLDERGFIRSSCMMEPGDSGGPLFDLDGRVIGIRSAIEVSEKNNYDVPVDAYLKYWQSLLTPTTYHVLPPQNEITDDRAQERKKLAVPELSDITQFDKSVNFPTLAGVAVESKINYEVKRVLGTVISLRGTPMEKTMGSAIIISKNSLVGDSVMVTLRSGKTVYAKPAFRDKENDLVLLQTTLPASSGIPFKQLKDGTAEPIKLGTLLISPQADTAAVVSISGSESTDLPKTSSAGFSGATAARDSKPAKIHFVRPGSPAALHNIKAGDLVMQVGETVVDNAAAYASALLKYWPGDTVSIYIKREDHTLNCQLLLTYPPPVNHHHPAEYFAGGKSMRRDGFAHIYVNDAVLQPQQCGGPVYGLTGRFYGIQIARFSRSSSLLLPGVTLEEFIKTAFAMGLPVYR